MGPISQNSEIPKCIPEIWYRIILILFNDIIGIIGGKGCPPVIWVSPIFLGKLSFIPPFVPTLRRSQQAFLMQVEQGGL